MGRKNLISPLKWKIMNKTAKVILIIILVLVLIVIVAGIVVVTTKGGNVKNLTGTGSSANKYYSVYVQTGNGSAVYYGQIVKQSEEYLVLKDPGYINVQPAQKEDEQPQVNFALMKDEFFKPLPEMTIFKNNIVFIQQLSDDSPIVSFYKNQAGK